MKYNFFLFLTFRVFIALNIQTVFDPDEFWQSLEVAHRLVFGFGYLTWEWMPDVALRGSLHPTLFVGLYKFLACFGMSTNLIWFIPKVMQGFLAAITDWFVLKLIGKVNGTENLSIAKYILLTNWFLSFCLTRTYSNCIESLFVVAFLFYWPDLQSLQTSFWEKKKYLWISLLFVALSCLIRPTAVVYIIPVFVGECLRPKHRFSFLSFLAPFVIVGLCSVLFSVLSDSFLYYWIDQELHGSNAQWKYRSSLINFAKFNVANNSSAYYGTHPWHWYLTQALPTTLVTFLPFFIVGVVKDRSNRIAGLPLWIIGSFSVFVHSLLPHKEFRFILPSLCLFMPIVQHGWIVAFEWIRKTNQNRCWTRFLQCLVFAPQIGMTVYFGLFHQRGPLSVMARIVELNGNCSGPCVQSVDFLTPCHAAPFYARTHIKPEKLRLRTLNCAPPLDSHLQSVSEVEQFFSHPVYFLNNTYSFSNSFESLNNSVYYSQIGSQRFREGIVSNETLFRSLPSFFVLYEPVFNQITHWLKKNNYVLDSRHFHAHFQVDDRAGDMLLFVKQDNKQYQVW